jgi:UDP-2-acetamido-2,6-beta-L-arabino-hexul-4-ose reductase
MVPSVRRVLITGANGFIGKNLFVRLNELANISVTTFVRSDDIDHLAQLVAQADAVVHLAGENRPAEDCAFLHVNAGLTTALCDAIRQHHAASGRHVPLVLASSIQATLDNPYGRSKLAAEQAVHALSKTTGNPCIVFRLPGVFGKWCKPDYNSVVATFCHNLARDLPIQINDPSALIRLVYIDDVVDSLLTALEAPVPGFVTATVTPEYTINLSELAEQIRAFSHSRTTLMSGRVGTGLIRALYATYVSYLPTERFSYQISQFSDSRGVFVEMLKTLDSGQISYFTAYPGATRGGHYHHTKTEKFLVIKGEALFRFRHLLTDELFELHASGSSPTVVDTIPGWVHEITNVGVEEMIVMLWANENFDQQKPDTVATTV